MRQTIGSVIIDVKSDTSHLVQGFDRAEKSVQKTTTNMKKAILSVGAAYLSFQSVKSFGGMIKSSIDAADATGKLAENLAISTESFSKLEYAAGFAGVSTNELSSAMKAMIRRANNFKKDGTGAAAKAMKTLGISAEFAKEHFTSTEVTFTILLNKLREMPDGFEKTAAAQDLFSKSAAGVVGMSSMSAKAIENYGKAGLKNGVVITDKMAAEAGILNDKLDELTDNFSGIGNILSREFLPALIDSTDSLQRSLPSIIENTKQIALMGGAVGGAVISIKAYNTAILLSSAYTATYAGVQGSLARAIVLSTISTKALNLALKANPYVLAATAIYTIGQSFQEATKRSDTFAVSLSKVSDGMDTIARKRLIEITTQLEEFDKRIAKMNDTEKLINKGGYEVLYKEQQKLLKIIAVVEQKKKEALNSNDDNGVAETVHISKSLLKLLDPLKAVKAKYEELRKQLKGTKEDTKSYRLELSRLEKEELSKLNKKVNAQIGKELKSRKDYYITLKQYDKAWKDEKSELQKSYNLKNNEEDNKFLQIKKDKFFKSFEKKELRIKVKLDTKKISSQLNQILNGEKGINAAEYQDSRNEMRDLGLNNAKNIKKVNDHFLKKYEKLNNKNHVKLGGAISSAVSTAVMSAINGKSSGRDIISTAAGSIGQSALSSGMKAGMSSLQKIPGIGAGGAMGIGVGLMAVSSLLKKPTKTLISQRDYLKELTKTNRDIAKQTRALEFLDRMFGTTTKVAKKGNFLNNNGSYYSFNNDKNGGVTAYFNNLYKDIADAGKIFKIKTGEKIYQKTKSGFMGIGASNKTVTENVYKNFFGNEVAALELLSQFGVNAKGKLTSEGLTNLQNAFNAFSSLSASISINGLKELEAITKQLNAVDVEKDKLILITRYADSYKKIGLNLFDVTYKTLDKYINDGTLAKLIKNDSSINVTDLTSSINSLNTAYKKEINLTKALNSLKLEKSKNEYAHLKRIFNLEKDVQKINQNNLKSYVNSFDSLFLTIENFAKSTKLTIDSILGVGLTNSQSSEFYIKRYNEVNSNFKKLFDDNGVLYANKETEAKDMYSRLNNLSSNIMSTSGVYGSDLSDLKTDLISSLDKNQDLFKNTKQAIRVNIIDGLGKLEGLTISQLSELKTAAVDGTITKDELSNIKGLTTDQIKAIGEVTKNTSALSTENTLSSMEMFAQKQLFLLTKQDDVNNKRISADSFDSYHELGKKEKLGLANLIGISGDDLNKFVEKIQLFDIKDDTKDLSHLKNLLGIGNSYFDSKGNAISFNKEMLEKLTKLSDSGFLRSDIANAYSTILREKSLEKVSIIDSLQSKIVINKDKDILNNLKIDRLEKDKSNVSIEKSTRKVYRHHKEDVKSITSWIIRDKSFSKYLTSRSGWNGYSIDKKKAINVSNERKKIYENSINKEQFILTQREKETVTFQEQIENIKKMQQLLELQTGTINTITSNISTVSSNFAVQNNDALIKKIGDLIKITEQQANVIVEMRDEIEESNMKKGAIA